MLPVLFSSFPSPLVTGWSKRRSLRFRITHPTPLAVSPCELVCFLRSSAQGFLPFMLWYCGQIQGPSSITPQQASCTITVPEIPFWNSPNPQNSESLLSPPTSLFPHQRLSVDNLKSFAWKMDKIFFLLFCRKKCALQVPHLQAISEHIPPLMSNHDAISLKIS